MTAAVCPVCVICEKPAVRGHLCLRHFDRLAQMLRDVESEACFLDARPSMAVHTGSGSGSLASERAPARLAVLAYLDPRTRRWELDAEPKVAAAHTPDCGGDCRGRCRAKSVGPWCLLCEHESCMTWRAGRPRDLHDDEHDAGSAALASVLEELHNWARLVREERDLTMPDRITVTGERDLLTRQLDWIAEQLWVDECYRDVRTILGQLQAVNNTAPDKPVGRCYLPADEGLCDGPIWVDDAEGHAHCGRCRATWDGPYLASLKFEMDRAKAELARPKMSDGQRMLTAQELADRHKTSVNAIRIRLSRVGAKATDGYYDPSILDRSKASA